MPHQPDRMGTKPRRSKQSERLTFRPDDLDENNIDPFEDIMGANINSDLKSGDLAPPKSGTLAPDKTGALAVRKSGDYAPGKSGDQVVPEQYVVDEAEHFIDNVAEELANLPKRRAFKSLMKTKKLREAFLRGQLGEDYSD